MSISASDVDGEGGGKGGRLERAFRRLGLFAALFIVGCAVFAPWVAPYPPNEQMLRATLAAPLWYPACEDGQIEPCNVNGIPLGGAKNVYYFALGADRLGRDVLSRIIYGARTSLSLAAAAVAIGAVFGAALGLAAGYRGGWVDKVVMRVAGVFDITLLYILIIWFILVPLAIQLVLMLGQSFMVVAIALAPGAWSSVARLVRDTVDTSFMTRHLPKAIVSAVVVGCVLQAGRVIVFEGVLSFTGVGVPPPAPSWGADISAGRGYVFSAWWTMVFPAMAILLTALAFNFAGGWLRDRGERAEAGGLPPLALYIPRQAGTRGGGSGDC